MSLDDPIPLSPHTVASAAAAMLKGVREANTVGAVNASKRLIAELERAGYDRLAAMVRRQLPPGER